MEITLNTTDDISQLETSVAAAAGYERAVVSSDEDSDEDNEDSKDNRHRARFRSERPEAQRTSSSSQPKTDIPDTLGESSEFIYHLLQHFVMSVSMVVMIFVNC